MPVTVSSSAWLALLTSTAAWAAKAKAAMISAMKVRNMADLLAVGPDDMSGWERFCESRPGA